MADIHIPFRDDMKQAIADGRKTATSRTKRYGKPGDRFQVDGRWYELIRITRQELVWVARRYWKDEGMDSEENFWQVWKQIHPRKKISEYDLVWFHEFKACDA